MQLGVHAIVPCSIPGNGASTAAFFALTLSNHLAQLTKDCLSVTSYTIMTPPGWSHCTKKKKQTNALLVARVVRAGGISYEVIY